MKKSAGLLIAALFLTLIGSNFQALAEHGHGRGHEEEKYACPITSKLMKKGHFYLENQTELGLSEEQVTKIKQIKHEAKKAHLRQMAEFQIAALDIQHALSQPQVDADALYVLIDRNSASMSQAAKDTVSAFISLKAVLTGEQQTKVRELWREAKK